MFIFRESLKMDNGDRVNLLAENQICSLLHLVETLYGKY